MRYNLRKIFEKYLNMFLMKSSMKIHDKINFLAVSVIIPMFAIVVILVFFLYGINNSSLQTQVEKEAKIITQRYNVLKIQAKTFIKLASKDDKMVKGIQLQKMSLVNNSLELFTKELGISFAAVHDVDGYSLGKSHKPNEYFKNDISEDYVKYGLKIKEITEPVIIETSEGNVLICSTTVYPKGDEMEARGILTGGYFINSKFAEALKADSKAEIVIMNNEITIGYTDKEVVKSIEKTKMYERTHKKTYNIKSRNKEFEAKSIILPSKDVNNNIEIIILLDFTKEKSMVNIIYFGIAFFMILCLFFTNVMLKEISKKIEEPVYQLVHVANEISNMNYDIRASIVGKDEMAVMAASLNHMLDKILAMNSELEKKVMERTAELHESMITIKNAQQQLIEAEKMASLGTLVAGVAHEINTPIGICVTAASFLHERTRETAKIYETNKMTKSDFELFMETAKDTTDIMLKNTQRAAELINSFKQIAVDQSTEDMRVFNVKTYIEDIFQSLSPKWKRTGHVVELKCDEDIEIKSYPGVFHQILTNLITNSLMHGFEDIENGKIFIELLIEDRGLILLYDDNGKGMNEESLKKIYDPFFTTKRGMGGTGLGMNIVYNLVSHKLKGTIITKSEPGKGIHVEITMPIIEKVEL